MNKPRYETVESFIRESQFSTVDQILASDEAEKAKMKKLDDMTLEVQRLYKSDAPGDVEKGKELQKEMDKLFSELYEVTPVQAAASKSKKRAKAGKGEEKEKTFVVRLTHDTTMSTDVEVQADSESAAKDKALDMDPSSLQWFADDGNSIKDQYVTHVQLKLSRLGPAETVQASGESGVFEAPFECCHECQALEVNGKPLVHREGCPKNPDEQGKADAWFFKPAEEAKLEGPFESKEAAEDVARDYAA